MDHQVSHALLLVCSNGDTCFLTLANATPSSFQLPPLGFSIFSLGVMKAALRIQTAWVTRKLEDVTWCHSAKKPLIWPEQVMDEKGRSFTNSQPDLSCHPYFFPLLKTGSENVDQAELSTASLDSVPPGSWSRLLDGAAEVINSCVAVCNDGPWDWNPIHCGLGLHNKIETNSWRQPKFMA